MKYSIGSVKDTYLVKDTDERDLYKHNPLFNTPLQKTADSLSPVFFYSLFYVIVIRNI